MEHLVNEKDIQEWANMPQMKWLEDVLKVSSTYLCMKIGTESFIGKGIDETALTHACQVGANKQILSILQNIELMKSGDIEVDLRAAKALAIN